MQLSKKNNKKMKENKINFYKYNTNKLAASFFSIPSVSNTIIMSFLNYCTYWWLNFKNKKKKIVKKKDKVEEEALHT